MLPAVSTNKGCRKAALAAAKRRGGKLGGDCGARLTAQARAADRTALQAEAQERVADTVKELQAAGCESLRAMQKGWRLAAFVRRKSANCPAGVSQ
jgi:hypothetical protein